MNRDDAHNGADRLAKFTGFKEAHDFIDEIYDYIESRTCENCMLWKTHNKHGTMLSINSCSVLCTDKDFGCNRFEEFKDD